MPIAPSSQPMYEYAESDKASNIDKRVHCNQSNVYISDYSCMYVDYVCVYHAAVLALKFSLGGRGKLLEASWHSFSSICLSKRAVKSIGRGAMDPSLVIVTRSGLPFGNLYQPVTRTVGPGTLPSQPRLPPCSLSGSWPMPGADAGT